MRGDQQLRLLQDLAAEDEFLQVAPGQACRRGLCVRRLHGETLDDLIGEGAHLAAADQPALDHAGLLEGSEQAVVGQAHARHRAVTEAFGRHEGHAVATASVGAQMGDVVTEKTNTHGLGGRQALFATEQGEQFVLAVAGDSGDTDDLAGAHFQVHLFEGHAERIGVVPGQPLDPQERRAALALRVFGFQPLGIADHQPREFQVRALGRHALAGHAAGAQHRGALAQRAHLVELVADEQDAAALGRQPAQGHEQLVGLLRGKHRGRFVEDQQADVLHQATYDLHPLALADGQAVHQPLWLQRHAVAL